jgi:hypothetical protein
VTWAVGTRRAIGTRLVRSTFADDPFGFLGEFFGQIVQAGRMEIVHGDFQVLHAPVSFVIRPALWPGLLASRNTFQFLGDLASFALHGLRDLVPVRFPQANHAFLEHLQPLFQELPHQVGRRIRLAVLDFLESLTELLAFALEIFRPRPFFVVHQMQFHLEVKRAVLQFEGFSEDVLQRPIRAPVWPAFRVDTAFAPFRSVALLPFSLAGLHFFARPWIASLRTLRRRALLGHRRVVGAGQRRQERHGGGGQGSPPGTVQQGHHRFSFCGNCPGTRPGGTQD